VTERPTLSSVDFLDQPFDLYALIRSITVYTCILLLYQSYINFTVVTLKEGRESPNNNNQVKKGV
jgi:hypothetical protein